jgi:hypothetical protein
MSGWIKIHRDINQHWIWQDNNYLKWWLDILLEVNHTEADVLIKGTVLKCGRGEKLYSLDTWANRWNTNKSKVNRFLKMLEKQNMILLKSETHTTRLKVCKYDDYQDKDSKSETQMKRKRNANETQVKPIQERKEREEGKEVYIDDDFVFYDAEVLEFSFDEFWNLYPNKTNKKSAKAKFDKLTKSQKEKIEQHLPYFISNKPFKEYNFPHATTYLNQERFNDEITINNQNLKIHDNGIAELTAEIRLNNPRI